MSTPKYTTNFNDNKNTNNSSSSKIIKTKNFLHQYRNDLGKDFQVLSAQQFSEIWCHYDRDNNGYIEGNELNDFLRELATSISGPENQLDLIPENIFKDLKVAFMEAYDHNMDGKLSIDELAEILPIEENFLLIFRRDNPLESSVDFMRIWKIFDADCSGFIEADELKEFIKELIHQNNRPPVTEEKLIEYADTILQLFDTNDDKKLQFSEMTKLLPVKENFLQRPIFKNCSAITQQDLDRVFLLYDKDENGLIEKEELDGFVKDLLELVKNDYDMTDFEEFKRGLLCGVDINRDGKISKSELKMVLIAMSSK